MSSTTPKQLESIQQSGPTDQSGSTSSSHETLRNLIQQLRNLPPDFLLLPRRANESSQSNQSDQSFNSSSNQAFSNSTIAGVAGTGSIMGSSSSHSGQVSMLDMTVVEASLIKNYGFLRMDCYCKIRVGHSVCETQTCSNGAKNPRWDGVFHFHLQPGIDSFHLEIYDEKQFSNDEKIAWLHVPIPKQVFEGVIIERWYPLSGRLGEGKEGSILLVMSHKMVTHKQATTFLRQMQSQMLYSLEYNNSGRVPRTTNYMGPNVPIYVGADAVTPNSGQQVISSNPQQPINTEDINQLAEMFPNVGKALIKTTLETNNGDKNLAISSLLALNSNLT